jgi:hypothetical protein
VVETNIELTQEQREEIAAKITQKWRGSRECPVCQVNAWALMPHLTTPVKLQGQTGKLDFPGTEVYPQAHLVCTNCGNTLTFNVTTLGIDLLKPQTLAERLYDKNQRQRKLLTEVMQSRKDKDDAGR